MAYDYSNKFFQENSFLKKPIRNILCKNWRLVSKYRSIFRKIEYYKNLKSNKNENSKFEINLKSDFSEYSEFFNKNHWCFIENFFSSDSLLYR